MKKILLIALTLTSALALSAAPAGRGTNTAGTPGARTNVVRNTTRTNTVAAGANQRGAGGYAISNAEVTKVTTNLISFKLANGNNYSMRINATSKVLIETPEVEKVPGNEGQTRFKTVEGKQTDLKPGVRIKASQKAGVATEVTILQPKDAKAGKEEKKDAPATK